MHAQLPVYTPPLHLGSEPFICHHLKCDKSFQICVALACLHMTAKEEKEQNREINYEKSQMHHRVVFFLLSLNNCAESSGLMWKAFEIQRLLITTPHRN